MRLSNGRHIDRRVKDSSGERGFVFWVSNCFDPPMYFVRGDGFDDAYSWFLVDPRIEEELGPDMAHLGDWIEGWDEKVQGKASLDDLADAFENGSTWLTMNDNGQFVDTEAVTATTLKNFFVGSRIV